MAKNNSLEVKRFGKGKERVTVAVLPGHEFEAKHFDPANLEQMHQLSSRVRKFKSRILPNEHFIRRVRRSSWSLKNLSAVNEAKVARFANQVAKANNFHDIVVEEPLAVHYGLKAPPAVFYRAISLGDPFTVLDTPSTQHYDHMREFIHKLWAIGIVPADTQYFFGADKRIHFYDVEYWHPSAELRKLLKLRKEK